MRVVVDTNVFISGLSSSSGPPGRVLDAWSNGTVELVLSQWLIGEHRKVTAYPHIVRATKRRDADLSAFSTFLPFGPMMVALPKVPCATLMIGTYSALPSTLEPT